MAARTVEIAQNSLGFCGLQLVDQIFRFMLIAQGLGKGEARPDKKEGSEEEKPFIHISPGMASVPSTIMPSETAKEEKA